MRRWSLGVLVVGLVVAVALALPFYGVDHDAVAAVRAAEQFWLTGVYIPSRGTGYVVHEGLIALIGGDTPLRAALPSLVGYALAVSGYATWHRDSPRARLAVVAFALHPVLLIAASTSMDYALALGLLVWVYALSARDRPVWAGLVLALAVGVRVTSVLWVLPLAVWAHRRGRVAQARWTALIGLAGFVFYVPTIVRMGLNGWLQARGGAISPKLHLMMAGLHGVELLGLIGWAVLGTALVLRLRTPQRGNEDDSAERDFDVVCLAVYGALFLWHPHEVAYLLPVLPSLFRRVACWLPYRSVFAVAVAVCAYGIVQVAPLGGGSGARTIHPHLAWGICIEDGLDRRRTLAWRESVAQWVPADTRAIVLTGMSHNLHFRNARLEAVPGFAEQFGLTAEQLLEGQNVHRVIGREQYLLYGASPGALAALESRGFSVYFLEEGAPGIAHWNFHHDLSAAGYPRITLAGL